jgi:hypothetical protein
MANYTDPNGTPVQAPSQVGGGVAGAMGAVPSPQNIPAQALPNTVTSVSLDLPPAIQSLIDMPAAGVAEGMIGNIPTGTVAENAQYPALDFRMQPTYEVGGMVGPGGMPQRPAGLQPQGPTGPSNPQMLEQQINQMLQQNPEVVARLRAGIEAGIQSGELDPNELNMIIQLAKTVMQNPEMYPQIRQMAIQRGIATEADLPAQYDEGLVVAIIAAAKSMEADVQFETAPQGGMQSAQMQQPQMSMATGGALPTDSPNADGSIPITAHEGEYVIPSHIVKAKGTEFFDSLLEKYKEKS